MQDDEAPVHVGDEVERPSRDPGLRDHPDDVEAVPGPHRRVRPPVTEMADRLLALRGPDNGEHEVSACQEREKQVRVGYEVWGFR